MTQDFPFYAGQPIALSAGRWLILLGTVVAGCVGLFAAPHLASGQAGRWIGALLFAGLPLVGLRSAAGRHWAAPYLLTRDIWS